MPQFTELTAFDVYNNYLNALKNANQTKNTPTMLKSGLLRYFIPFVGGIPSRGVRSTPDEARAGMEILKQLPSGLLSNIPTVVEQAFIDLAVPKDSRRPYRSVLKSFAEWASSYGYCSTKDEEVRVNQPYFPPAIGKKSFRQEGGHGAKHKAPYALMAKISGGTPSERGKPYFPNDYINQDLAEDLEAYRNFRAGCADSTIGMELRDIHSTLGWLHRYKHVPLEDLRLTSIIEFSPINTSLSICLNDSGQPDMNCYLLKKAILREQAFEKAVATNTLALEYINFIAGHPKTQRGHIRNWIEVAKLLYKDEVGSQDYPEYRDIPVIKKLDKLNAVLKAREKNTPDTVPHHKKSIPWEQALEIVERLRRNVDVCDFYYSYGEPGNAKPMKRKRNPSTIAEELQKFLSIAFITLMPPDRSRTYYELEIGRTFVFGVFKGSHFVPGDKMKDKSKGEFYIHLEPTDYKTGKIYGEWWGKVPNVEFADGTTFYGYINRWLTWGRELDEKLKHNFFFIGIYNHKPIPQSNWNARFVDLFDREAGMPVTPKELRKMYVTYLKNSGASEAVLEAAACAMHHSRRMQSGVYDQQEQMEKIAPAFEFNERVAAKMFSKGAK